MYFIVFILLYIDCLCKLNVHIVALIKTSDLVPPLAKAQWTFISAIPINTKLPIQKQGAIKNFKGLLQYVGRLKFAENFRVSPSNKELASPLNKELSIETTLSQIHLAGQYH